MIEILLSTYNGEQFLSEQIDSIIHQSFTDWKLIIRDDGSSDSTNAIIESYCNLLPEKICKLNGRTDNIGVIRSFELLLSECQSEYIMFCDQDDVWLPNKIERSFFEIKLLEKKHTADSPLLVHTDLIVVDEELTIINKSFWNFTHLNPDIIERNSYFLGIANCVTGCTMLFNSAAKKVALPFPENCLMHDAHIALAVKKHGYITHIAEPTINYRQHSKNKLGAIQFVSLTERVKQLNDVVKTNKIRYKAAHPIIFKSVIHYLYYKILYTLVIHTPIKKIYLR